MVRARLLALMFICLAVLTVSCQKESDEIRIGVSFGVDTTERWPLELHYMHERAGELGIALTSRLSTSANPMMQYGQCDALIEEGVKVLIVMSRNFAALKDLYVKARQRGIKIVCYSRMPMEFGSADLSVAFDNYHVGRAMGQFLSELVPSGNYIFLRGDSNDSDARDIYWGARDALPQYGNGIRVVSDIAVPQWSPRETRELVRAALIENAGSVDAILAPNDQMAEASRLALDDLGISRKIPITGFTAEREAIHRLLKGTQCMTVLADYRLLAREAVDQAVALARGKTPKTNKHYTITDGKKVDAMLVPCQIITPENIETRIIEPGIYTRNEVFEYGF